MTTFAEMQEKLNDKSVYVDELQLSFEEKLIAEIIDTTDVNPVKAIVLQYYKKPWYRILYQETLNESYNNGTDNIHFNTAITKIQDRFYIERRYAEKKDRVLQKDTAENAAEQQTVIAFYTKLAGKIQNYIQEQNDFIRACALNEEIKNYVSAYFSSMSSTQANEQMAAARAAIIEKIKAKLDTKFNDAQKSKLAHYYFNQILEPVVRKITIKPLEAERTAEENNTQKAANIALESAYATYTETEHYDRTLAEQRLAALKASVTQIKDETKVTEIKGAIALIEQQFENLSQRIYRSILIKQQYPELYQANRAAIDDFLNHASLINEIKIIDQNIAIALKNSNGQHHLLQKPLKGSDADFTKVEEFKSKPLTQDAYVVRKYENWSLNNCQLFFTIHERLSKKTISTKPDTKNIYPVKKAIYDEIKDYTEKNATNFWGDYLASDEERKNIIAENIEAYKQQRAYIFKNVVYPIIHPYINNKTKKIPYFTQGASTSPEKLVANSLKTYTSDEQTALNLAKMFLKPYTEDANTEQAHIDLNSVKHQVKTAIAKSYKHIADQDAATYFLKEFVALGKDISHLTFNDFRKLQVNNLTEFNIKYNSALRVLKVEGIEDAKQFIIQADNLRDTSNPAKAANLNNLSPAELAALGVNNQAEFNEKYKSAQEVIRKYNNIIPAYDRKVAAIQLEEVRKRETKRDDHKAKIARVARDFRSTLKMTAAAIFLKRVSELKKTETELTNLSVQELKQLGFRSAESAQTDFNEKYKWAKQKLNEEQVAHDIRYQNIQDQTYLQNEAAAYKQWITKWGGRIAKTAAFGTALTLVIVITGGFMGMSTLSVGFMLTMLGFGVIWVAVDKGIDAYWAKIEQFFFKIPGTDRINLLVSEKWKRIFKTILYLVLIIVMAALLASIVSFTWYFPVIAAGVFVASKFMNTIFFKGLVAALIDKFATTDGYYKLKFYYGYIKNQKLTEQQIKVLKVTFIGNIVMAILYASLTFLKIQDSLSDYVGAEKSTSWIAYLVAAFFSSCIFIGYLFVATTPMAKFLNASWGMLSLIFYSLPKFFLYTTPKFIYSLFTNPRETSQQFVKDLTYIGAKISDFIKYAKTYPYRKNISLFLSRSWHDIKKLWTTFDKPEDHWPITRFAYGIGGFVVNALFRLTYLLPVAALLGMTAILTVSRDSFAALLEGAMSEDNAKKIADGVLLVSMVAKGPAVLLGAFQASVQLVGTPQNPEAEQLKSLEVKFKQLCGADANTINDFEQFVTQVKECAEKDKSFSDLLFKAETLIKITINAALQSELAIHDVDNPGDYLAYETLQDYLYGGGAFAQSMSLAMLNKQGFEREEAIEMVNRIARAYKKEHEKLLKEYTENNPTEAINKARKLEVAKYMAYTEVNGKPTYSYKKLPLHVRETIDSERPAKLKVKAFKAAQEYINSMGDCLRKDNLAAILATIPYQNNLREIEAIDQQEIGKHQNYNLLTYILPTTWYKRGPTKTEEILKPLFRSTL